MSDRSTTRRSSPCASTPALPLPRSCFALPSRRSTADLLRPLHRGGDRDLVNRAPDESAYRVLTPNQKIVFGAALLLFAICFAWRHRHDRRLQPVSIVSTRLFSAYKFKLMYRRSVLAGAARHRGGGSARRAHAPGLHDPRAALEDHFGEGGRRRAAHRSIRARATTEDEARREADREETTRKTIEAIRDVPSGALPRRRLAGPPAKTKPKACNYGLIPGRGPLRRHLRRGGPTEADQLKKVVIAFRKAEDRIICVNGRASTTYRSQNILTRWFPASTRTGSTCLMRVSSDTRSRAPPTTS